MGTSSRIHISPISTIFVSFSLPQLSPSLNCFSCRTLRQKQKHHRFGLDVVIFFVFEKKKERAPLKIKIC